MHYGNFGIRMMMITWHLSPLSPFVTEVAD